MTSVPHDRMRGFGLERRLRADRALPARHLLTVVAANVIDAVTNAGGLIFDRARSGWDVNVYLAESGDGRALEILGVHARELLPYSMADLDGYPDSLLVAGKLYETNGEIGRLFQGASSNRRTEVAVWGEEWPADLTSGIGQVQHRLSLAARAFKAHSITAAGVARPHVAATESFYGRAHRCSIAAPLQPVVRSH